MTKIGKLFVIAVLVLTLLFSVVAVSASASPVHVGGSSVVISPSLTFSGGVTADSSPIHVGGS